MEEERDEALATAFVRAIQALESMLTSLRRTARAAARVRDRAIARRLDELTLEVEASLHGLRKYAAANRSRFTSRRNGR